MKLHGEPPCRLGNRIEVVPGGPVSGTLGCAEFDEEAARIAPEILAAGEPQLRTLTHDLGSVEVLFEPVLPPALLAIVSATDVARELCLLAKRLGWSPALVEPRSERIRADDRALPWTVVGSLDALALDARSAVVFTDHDAPGLVEQLAVVLRSPAGFVGVMGSRRHVAPFLEELRAAGFSEAELERVRTPLGLDLGGQRPVEIALSIAAGLVAARHGREGRLAPRAPMSREPVRSARHVRKNRRYWEGTADAYQAEHGPQLARLGRWGIWGIPERRVGALGDVRGLDVLEYGCGGAQWSIWLARQGARVVGMDLSARQLVHARGLVARARVHVPLVQADAERTPFADASFDLVMCDHGAMSFADPHRTVPEVARLLRAGGRLVFNTASAWHFVCWGERDRLGERAAPAPLLRHAPVGRGLGGLPAPLRRVDPPVPPERLRGPRPHRAPALALGADHVPLVRTARLGAPLPRREHLGRPAAGMSPRPTRLRARSRPDPRSRGRAASRARRGCPSASRRAP
ncbi:MAG: hypothetical protein KatS3mg014_2263 [Actinomycetota bacterium]|nr:MAG: hypothetical protein KatS3mg014_2263 [Actinomycetota bacterium]